MQVNAFNFVVTRKTVIVYTGRYIGNESKNGVFDHSPIFENHVVFQ